MYKEDFFNPLKNSQLFFLENKLSELINVFEKNSLPNSILFSGKKGIGKFTMAIHFINYIFSKNTNNTYDLKKNSINQNSLIFKQINENIFQNLIILNKNTKIEDIRNLKFTLSKTSINGGPRFIILDDVEIFNINCINALLKSLEEPTNNNYFILIDNQTTKLLETVSSRCSKINFFITGNDIDGIIEKMCQYQDIKIVIDNSKFKTTPGNFLRYNKICADNDLNMKSRITDVCKRLLSLYKIDKDRNKINLLKLFVENYFYELSSVNIDNIDIFNNLKKKILNGIDDYVKYNLNINSVLSSFNFILSNEKK